MQPQLRAPQAAVLLLALSAACGSSESVWPALSTDDVSVYYPVGGIDGAGGRIAVRVTNAALPEGATTLSLTTFPTDQRFSYAVEEGDYTNLVVTASTAAILEISAQGSGKRGDALFVQVPVAPRMLPCVRCLEDKCTEAACAKVPTTSGCGALHCQGLSTVVASCRTTADCVTWSGQALSIPAEGLGITWAGSDPAVAQLQVQTEPGELLWVKNQHLTASGQASPAAEAPQLKIATSTLTSIRLPSARAGDQILFRLYDKTRSFSPLGEQRVGQPQIGGVALVGVETYHDHAVYFVSPYGEDQRGYCPLSDNIPPLCYGGGLTTGDVRLGSRDGTASSTIAVHGELREGPTRVVLLVDVGKTAQALDENLARVDLALEVLRQGLRSFDSLSLMVFGPDGAVELPDFSVKGVARSPSADGSFTKALERALSLQIAGASLKIVAIIASQEQAEGEEGKPSRALLHALKEVPVHIVDIGAGAYTGEGLDLEELAVIGGGELWPSMPYSATRLQSTLARVRNNLIGSFLVRFEGTGWQSNIPPLYIEVGGSSFTKSFIGVADE